MKIMQVVGAFCHWDATRTVPSLAAAARQFAPDMVFVEAPDHVFPGWGYDSTREGDERFIKPTPPRGWLYDDATGTMYRETDTAPSKVKTVKQLTEENNALQAMVTDLELALCDMYESLLAATGG